ncbi:MAG: phytoene desaturase [Deltaproteobacteria bacterium]|nr:phytoene desaturase [Deltaproteobacteria bacterium]
MPRVVVVGAGVGGLASAIDLAAAGLEVVVLERAGAPGGKARVARVGEASIDAGPTVFTMPWVFDELYEAAGASFRAELAIERSNVIARHAWRDGTTFDLFDDRERSADAIGQVFGARDARAFRTFCEDGRKLFEISEIPFLRSQRPTFASIVRDFGAAGLTAFARLDCARTMWRSLQSRFGDPRLVQLFGRYATYCGSSPFEAPATLNLIAHVEAEGVFRCPGGTHALVLALVKLLRSLGGEVRYEEPVDHVIVERGRVAGVVARGARHEADFVVFNGDVSAVGSGLLGGGVAGATKATPRRSRSLSAVTWAMVARASGFPLVRHNVFFADDYAAEFTSILERGRVSSDPTVYVCAQDRADVPHDAGDERLLVLVNAPANGDEAGRWSEEERERCLTASKSVMERMGLRLEPSASVTTTPAEFHRMFPGTGGALYGPRSDGMLSAFGRQSARSKIPGLYFAGGSAHPGPGVPMAALSGRLAAARVREDLDSTARSRRAATTGTTSTG